MFKAAVLVPSQPSRVTCATTVATARLDTELPVQAMTAVTRQINA
jgi:hypothetical protein